MSKYIYIPKRYLILLAGIVWSLAGFNILRIGVLSTDQLNVIIFLSALLTCFLFYKYIFQKLVQKHTLRISASEDERMHILKFFDKKSYLIMFVMMTLGITIRALQLWPNVCIKSFYVGLGFALLMAGIGFFIEFYKWTLKDSKTFVE